MSKLVHFHILEVPIRVEHRELTSEPHIELYAQALINLLENERFGKALDIWPE